MDADREHVLGVTGGRDIVHLEGEARRPHTNVEVELEPPVKELL